MLATQQRLQTVYWGSVGSQAGETVVIATELGVCWVGTPGTPIDEGLYRTKRYLALERVVQDRKVESLACALEQLERYFASEKLMFHCPLDLRGTAFQVKVWQEMCNIAYGETRSYGEIAQAIGHPLASRAVGAASGANPVAIIVPCHRVIGRNGTLTGYGGGLPTKAWLLALEGVRSRV